MCTHILHRIAIKGYSELKFPEVSASLSNTLQTATLIERNIVTVKRWKGFVAFDNYQPLIILTSTQLLDQLSTCIAKLDA